MSSNVFFANVFTLNFKLMFESGYFDVSHQLKPLMHLWSLSIEEQFYVIAPIIFYFGLKRRRFLEIFGVLAVVLSFVVSVLDETSVAYLNTVSRIWEIGIGCVVGYLHFKGWMRVTKEQETLSNVSGVVGMGLILGSAVMLDENMPFPSWRAVFPCVGACLVIGMAEHSKINKVVLSFRPMVWIGLISYPLYLWHWPVLSFWVVCSISERWNVVPGTQKFSFSLGFGPQLVAFVLAALTHFSLEQPLRHAKKHKVIFSTLIGSMCIIGLFGYLGMSGTLDPLCMEDPVLHGVFKEKNFEEWSTQFKNFDRWSIPGYTNAGYDLFRARGGIDRRVVFIGDSNCIQYLPRIDEHLSLFPSRSYGSIFWAAPANCPIAGYVETRYPLANFMTKAMEYLESDKDAFKVVLSAAWTYHMKNDNWILLDEDGKIVDMTGKNRTEVALVELEKTVIRLRQMNKEVVIVLTVPGIMAFDPNQMIRREGIRIKANVKEAKRSDNPTFQNQLHHHMRNILGKHGVKIIDPMECIFENSTEILPFYSGFRFSC